jgi:AraC-like DNA-binding protein
MIGPGEREEADSLAVTGLGVLWVRQQGFTIDRPNGLGDAYTLLRFYTPMLVHTTAGMAHGEPGDCLLYEPTFPQWFTGRGVGYIDDWLHITPSGVPELISRYRVPANTLFRPRDLDFFSPTLQAINEELHRREPFWRDSIRILVEQLFMRLGRAVEEQEAPRLAAPPVFHPDVVRSVRMHVHERLEERWTIPRMAQLAHMSTSRFAVLYKRLLGVSPAEDLIEARLARAQELLTNSGMSVSEVAAQTGFRSSSYFSRIFRRRIGIRPRDYRHSLVRKREPVQKSV